MTMSADLQSFTIKVTSPYKWKILDWDAKPQITKNPNLFPSNNVIICDIPTDLHTYIDIDYCF